MIISSIDIVIFLSHGYHTEDMNDKNFFQFFDLPISYNIDEAELMRVYFGRQRALHPDSVDSDYVNNSDVSASELNAAYQTLKNPVDRAEHYLRVRGIPILEHLPTDFAEKMFNMRQKYDSLQNELEKKEFIMSLKKCTAEIISSLQAFEANDLEKFRKYTCLLRFIDSFLEKVELNAYSRN